MNKCVHCNYVNSLDDTSTVDIDLNLGRLCQSCEHRIGQLIEYHRDEWLKNRTTITRQNPVIALCFSLFFFFVLLAAMVLL